LEKAMAKALERHEAFISILFMKIKDTPPPTKNIPTDIKKTEKAKGKTIEPKTEKTPIEKEPMLGEMFRGVKRPHIKPWNKMRLNITHSGAL